ncbi:MAG: radical SAM protein, partial [Phycisphaerae bacterium]|nr:radical SAM protein [Phycisphaerae bacterium]
GIHPSALPDEALQHADVVCKGDAEGTLPHALQDISAGRAKMVYDWQDNPDAQIARPRKDLFNPKDYLVLNPIQTTRGCPHGCTFCTTPAIFGRKFRQRKIADIVEEMRAAKEAFNTRVFIFSDDDVAGNHAWAMELFESLKPLNIKWASQCDILISSNDKLLAAMRDSGCMGIILGLESPKAGTLREAGKRYVDAGQYTQRIRKIQSYGISIWGSFIFGFDSDDWRDCMNAVRFAQRAKLCMSCYPILTPYPGTQIFEQYHSEGRLLTQDWDKYNGATVVYQPMKMSINELRHAQMAAFYEFYSPASSFQRLKLWPIKRNSWLANLAIHRGLTYYYAKRARPLPRFADYIAPDAGTRIARSLGQTNGR